MDDVPIGVFRLNDATRIALGLPYDCGTYDPIRDVWLVSNFSVLRYSPGDAALLGLIERVTTNSPSGRE